MNPLLLTLLEAAIKYTFDAIARHKAQTGTEPTYEQVWDSINKEINQTIADGEAWKARHPGV